MGAFGENEKQTRYRRFDFSSLIFRGPFKVGAALRRAVILSLILAPSFFVCQIASHPARASQPLAPTAEMTFDLQLQENFDFAHPTSVVVLDLFRSTPSIINFLAAKGAVPLCQIEVASLASFRPDAKAFAPTMIGKEVAGDPRYNWLDIRRRSALAPQIRDRLKLCKSKGFFGALLVNLNAYQVNTGFLIEKSDMENYLRFLSYEAKRLNLTLGLYQVGDLSLSLHPYFDFAVADRCYETAQCDLFLPFIKQGKPVFSINRSKKAVAQEAFCNEMDEMGFSGLIKPPGGDVTNIQCRDLPKAPPDSMARKKRQ